MSNPEKNKNLTEKLMMTSLCALLTGRSTNIKIRGTQNEIAAVSNALLSTKKLQEELNRPDATVDSVMKKLQLKRAAVSEFENLLGLRWPL